MPDDLNTPELSDQDIPAFVRRCYEHYQAKTEDERRQEKQNLGMWVGGEYQWRDGETELRQGQNRPWVTINQLKPAVDQVENEARNNPPGPHAEPVGGGADSDTADILEGLIREYEYRSDAKTASILALRYAAAGGRGCLELATEFAGERTLEQRLVVKPVTDPSTVFYDPDAVLPSREDAMWAGKIRKLSRDQLLEEYGGVDLKVLNRNVFQRAGGWISDAVKWQNDSATINEWTGGAANKGPYYVCEFYRVIIERKRMTLWSDDILRYDDEKPPEGAIPKSRDGETVQRWEPTRRVQKYVVTALDLLDQTPWLGTIPPFFWVMGPEVRIEGKVERLCLTSGAQDSQRGLNYTATCALEILGAMTKAPWIGYKGQFDTTNAQGINPWHNSNGKLWPYLEVKPTWASSPDGMKTELLPPPQRNTWEAPIVRIMELINVWSSQIKSATAVFFEPNVASAAQAQSGEAIKALQSQTNIGTINWQDQLRRAKQLEYWQASIILPQILDGPRVVTIVRPDSKQEIELINQEFPAHELDHATGKRRTKDGKLESRKNIAIGKYSLRVTAGPNFETRAEKSVQSLTEAFRIVPQMLAVPMVMAKFLRLVGRGDPEVEAIAEDISPDPAKGPSPEQMQTELQKAQAMIKAQGIVIQKLQSIATGKMSEIEAKKWTAAVSALAGIREAEIKAGIDQAQTDEAALEHFTGLAHDAAQQELDRQHEQQLSVSEQPLDSETTTGVES